MRLDHVLIGVNDLDAAVSVYEGLLGLPAAVRSDHPTYGTRNALFIPERGPYIELLSLRAEASEQGSASALRGFLERNGGPGLYGIALAPDDINQTVREMRTAGVAITDAAPGTGVDAEGRVREWRNTRIPPEALHGSHSLLIEHSGWDWRNDLRRPPLPGRERSAVRRVDHAVFFVQDADAGSAMWERRFGLPRLEAIPMPEAGGVIAVHRAGDTNIELIAPTNSEGRIAQALATTGERFSSLSVEVPDVEAAVRDVRACGAEVSDARTGILPGTRIATVAPAYALGVPLQLLQRTA